MYDPKVPLPPPLPSVPPMPVIPARQLPNFEQLVKLPPGRANKTWHKPKLCPDCGSTMRLRYSRFGAFFGCSQFPDCKGTRRLPDKKKKRR